MIEYIRQYNSPIIIDQKLGHSDVKYPRWEVDGETYWSKYDAVKACVRTGWEWPGFELFDQDGFKRPDSSFQQACFKQCEIISDTSRKVRHFYSGGQDSHHVLECFLASKSRIDEIVSYRRFPGSYENVNEYDRFNVADGLIQLLRKYDVKIPVKVYDLMPEHFEFFSNNLEKRYFPYTDIRFVAHCVQPLAEFYPELLDKECTNVISNAFPTVDTDSGTFHYIDGNFNTQCMDPYVCHFFADSRNTDLVASMAYHLYDNNIKDKYNGRRSLKYYTDGSPLHDCSVGDISTFLTHDEREWIWDMKDMRYHADMITSETGRQSLKRFISFYQDTQTKYQRFFENGSIWNGWIGSITKKYKLTDI